MYNEYASDDKSQYKPTFLCCLTNGEPFNCILFLIVFKSLSSTNTK